MSGSDGDTVKVTRMTWLCENALAEALATRNFGEVAKFDHLAVFGGLFLSGTAPDVDSSRLERLGDRIRSIQRNYSRRRSVNAPRHVRSTEAASNRVTKSTPANVAPYSNRTCLSATAEKF